MDPSWYDHILFALIGIVIPLMSIQSRVQQDESEVDLDLPPKKHLYYNNFFVLLIGMLLCFTAWNAGKNDWSLLGFKNIVFHPIAIGAAVLLVTFYILDGVISYRSFHSNAESINEMKHVIPLTWQEYFSFIPLAFMAGISEEVIYRGYLYHYLLSFFPTSEWAPYLAIIIASLCFSLSHLYQGWYAIVKIFLISLLFGLIYLYSRSLIGVMVIHIVIDLVSGMVSVIAFKEWKAKSEE